ncbi:MAG: chemotaxis protein CheX [Magnetococcales bacterium]|nr:chemotaxis protein CheX [Magnetococcales bacterium]
MDHHQDRPDQDRLVSGLRDATIQVLRTMAGREVAYVGLSAMNQFVLKDEACGVVRLRGSVSGLVAISCGLDLAQYLVSCIIGVAIDEIGQEELLDGVSELTNMICGGVKTHLGGGGGVELLPPLAVVGSEYVAQWKTDCDTSVLLFRVDDNTFRVYASV